MMNQKFIKEVLGEVLLVDAQGIFHQGMWLRIILV
jgi:hypothetical protein